MEGAEVFGFTTPLITTASGGKMGKTADGAVWLNGDPDLGEAFTRSPYEYWQFWRNTEDADTERFLKLFTDLPLDEIADIVAGDAVEAKVRLADEATALLHGQDAAAQAKATAKATFSGGAGAALPTTEVTLDVLLGMGILNAAVTAGLAASNGEARRHIKAGALKLNNAAVTTHEATIGENDISDGIVKLSVGKKRHALLKAVAP